MRGTTQVFFFWKCKREREVCATDNSSLLKMLTYGAAAEMIHTCVSSRFTERGGEGSRVRKNKEGDGRRRRHNREHTRSVGAEEENREVKDPLSARKLTQRQIQRQCNATDASFHWLLLLLLFCIKWRKAFTHTHVQGRPVPTLAFPFFRFLVPVPDDKE